MILRDSIRLIYLAVCLFGKCVLCQQDDIAHHPDVATAEASDPLQQPLDHITTGTTTNAINNAAHDPEGSFYKTLEDNVNKKTPVDRLDEMTKDVTKEMNTNPYYKIPKLDRKLRELAVLHPDVMEKLGVYVITLKGNPSQDKESIPIDEKPLAEDNGPAAKAANPMQSNLSHIIKQSEMIKVMTPEEKLHFIPRLKETIVYEILKNTQTIDSLTAQIAQQNGF